MRSAQMKCILVGFCTVITITAHAAYPLVDDFEAGATAWSASGTWALTTLKTHSPTHAMTDSPGALYTNNSESAFTMSSGLDLSSASTPALRFYHQTFLETDYDFGHIDVSTNGGASWGVVPLASYTGNRGVWTREQVDLSSYAGLSDVRIRFRIATDYSVIRDGWYVDDIRIDEAPQPPTGLLATNILTTSLELRWTPSVTPGVTGYRVYRSTRPRAEAYEVYLLGEVPATATNIIDHTVNPKTSYTYWLVAADANAMESVSAERSTATPSGMDFPLLDDGEGGSGTWDAEAPWALSSEDAASPTHAWSDSPGTVYSNGIASQSLTLGAPFSLVGATSPVLTFHHQYDIGSGDSANIEISLNHGAAWSTLLTLSGIQTNWMRHQIALTPYTNEPAVLLRFRITTDTSNQGDGWHLDDIALSEQPAVINAPALSEITSHSIRLTWGRYTNDNFSHYAVFRSTTPGVGINSTLVTNIYDINANTLVDGDLALDSPYYYRVYAVNHHGALSPDSPGENSARTRNNPMPFSETFELALTSWSMNGGWGQTDEYAHSGSYAFADSPGTTYTDSVDSSAQTSVDLRGSTWPVLRFWERRSLAAGDWAYVDVSPDGATWTRVCSFGAGQFTNWQERAVDLSEWRTQPNLRLRLRITTDASATDQGWYVDDLSITDHTPTAQVYPFREGFEGGLTNWIASAWGLETNGAYTGSQALSDAVPGDHLPVNTAMNLALEGPLDLSDAVDPQIVLWLKGNAQFSGYSSYTRAWLRVYASTDNGLTWEGIWSIDGFDFPTWQQQQAAIGAALHTTNTRIRVHLSASSNTGAWPSENVSIDRLVIKERPIGVSFNPPVPHLKTIDLSWNASTLGADFKHYQIFRSTDVTVDANDVLIGTFTNSADTSFVDTGLTIGNRYYYGIRVTDQDDICSLIQTCDSATVALTAPLSDDMDNLDNWMDSGEGWGLDTNIFHSATASLADSPYSLYENSQDRWIMTSVDISAMTWPVLRFWERRSLAAGDWAYVDVSPDGATWTHVCSFGAGQFTNWQERAVDLSEWRTQPNLRLRLRITTDASATDQGWYVDDLSITDHTPTAQVYPFREGFEGGLTNWIASAWGLETNGAYTGSQALSDAVPGDHLPVNTAMNLALEGPLDLSDAVDPQIVLWLKGNAQFSGYSSYTRAWLRVYASTDNGLTWEGIWSIDGFDFPTWQQQQAAIGAALHTTNTRIRVYLSASSNTGAWPGENVSIDRLVIKERPTGVGFKPPLPHLKTIDLSWNGSTLGDDFKRYDVFRSPDATVDASDLLIGSFTNIAETAMVDTGLAIGTHYYYGIRVADQDDTYSLIQTCDTETITVALTAPLSDGMDNLDNWISSGEGWGPDTNVFHSATASLADSPGSLYENSQDRWIMTSVDLSAMTWPVLRFWERRSLAAGDWAYVDVSTDGGTWTHICSFGPGQFTNWQERAVDLSEWRTQPNLRLRLRITTDASATDQGWYVDDLSITDHTPTAQVYPFREGFEGGLTNWIASAWGLETNGAYTGSQALSDAVPGDHLPVNTAMNLALEGPLDLSDAVDPQIVLWLKGNAQFSGYSSYTRAWLRVYASTDNGLTWEGIWSIDGFDFPTWQQQQAAIGAALHTTNTRIRVHLSASSNTGAWPSENVSIDRLVIKERPIGVSFNPPVPHLKTIELSWNASTLGADFKRYEVYRSTDVTVDASDMLIGTFTNSADTALIDTGLIIGNQYYYGIRVTDQDDIYSLIQTCDAQTVPLNAPVVDAFDTLDQWVTTEGWGLDTNTFRSSGAALADSPDALYPNSNTRTIMTSVNISGMTWPVLTFWEQAAFVAGDWAYVYVSTDGSSWTRVYAVTGGQSSNWVERTLDLSPWRTQQNLRIRFTVSTDGSLQDEGWYLDDLSIAEHTPVAHSYPLWEDMEGCLTNWLNGQWVLDTNTVHEGAQALSDGIVGDYLVSPSVAWLVLNGPIDLSATTNPQLAFWLKGNVQFSGYSSYTRAWLRVQVSKDNGLNWINVWAVDEWSYPDWQLQIVSLAAHREPNVRIRIELSSSSNSGASPNENIAIDNFAIGDATPSRPIIDTPKDYENVSELRPQLTVSNAISYLGDLLEYRFEVYTDATLSNLVAQVPNVSSGEAHTSWVVDEDLENDNLYWWQCQAINGTNFSAWSEPAAFYVNRINNPPLRVSLVGPPPASILHDGAHELSWHPTSDPDEGDVVASYQLQVDVSAAFTNPVINDAAITFDAGPTSGPWVVSMPLSTFSGWGGLEDNTSYFWRMRARDQWDAWSDWSTNIIWFIYGTPPPTIMSMSATAENALAFEWERSGTGVYVEYSPSLIETNWEVVAGPIYGTNITVTPVPGKETGFYRVRTQ